MEIELKWIHDYYNQRRGWTQEWHGATKAAVLILLCSQHLWKEGGREVWKEKKEKEGRKGEGKEQGGKSKKGTEGIEE